MFYYSFVDVDGLTRMLLRSSDMELDRDGTATIYGKSFFNCDVKCLM